MNAFVTLASLFAAASASTVQIAPVGQGIPTFRRAPAHDSASIESHRLGGNFAYATAEAHAFAKVTPQISRATFPVAETTHVHEPEVIAHVQPAPIVRTHHAARPVLAEQPIIAHEPVVGPIGQTTQVHQQVYKTQHLVQHQPAVAVEYAAAPALAAVEYAAAPAVAAVAAAPAAIAAAPAAIGAIGVNGYAAGINAYAAGIPAVTGYSGIPAIAAGHLAAAAPLAAY